jgi:hypothetical protein
VSIRPVQPAAVVQESVMMDPTALASDIVDGFQPDGSFCHSVAPRLRMRLATPLDNEQLLQLVSVPMPSNGVMVGMERAPSYFQATQTQYTDPQPWVIVSDDQPDLIMAMYNLGERPCYVNGTVTNIRYVGDLRVNQQVRGKGLVHLMMKQLTKIMLGDDYAQTLILSDNAAARKMLHNAKSGFPPHYHMDDVKTLTMTGVRQAPNRAARQMRNAVQFRSATVADAAAMTALVERMSAYYNFLPVYDFQGLVEGSPYWMGLQFSDFTLIFRAGELVGMFGLWNQKSFKQTRIVDYSQWVGLARPLYNFWASLTQTMPLPKRGELVGYLMLHSALCDPKDVALFDVMVREAFRQTKARGQSALCYTLSEADPRVDSHQYFKGELIRGMHAFHSFGKNPLLTFDRQRISYLECGRV